MATFEKEDKLATCFSNVFEEDGGGTMMLV
jgi:hypothetical protein